MPDFGWSSSVFVKKKIVFIYETLQKNVNLMFEPLHHSLPSFTSFTLLSCSLHQICNLDLQLSNIVMCFSAFTVILHLIWKFVPLTSALCSFVLWLQFWNKISFGTWWQCEYCIVGDWLPLHRPSWFRFPPQAKKNSILYTVTLPLQGYGKQGIGIPA